MYIYTHIYIDIYIYVYRFPVASEAEGVAALPELVRVQFAALVAVEKRPAWCIEKLRV